MMDGSAILTTVEPPTRSRPAGIALPAAGWVLIAVLVAFGAWYGVKWRADYWNMSQSIRFTYDITNGYDLGRSVVEQTRIPAGQPVPFAAYLTAYLDAYAGAVKDAEKRPRINNGQPDYHLDYAPGRLFIMSMWVRHLWQQGITAWNRDDATTAPLLRVNAIASAITAVAMGLLVRHWRRYRDGLPALPDWRSPWRELPAVFAMLAVWLNPALIWNAHAWPQWDCWLLPFFVIGVLLASKQQWLAAGFVIAIGALFKGQLVITTPVLILWALFTGRPVAAVRFLIGVALLAALVALMWIAREPTARLYLAGCGVAILAGVLVPGSRRKFDAISIVVASIAGVLVALVLVKSFNLPTFAAVVLLVGLIAIAPRWTPRPLIPAAVAVAIAGCIFLAGYAWGEPYHWFEVSYVYPTHRRQYMSIGPITNLPALLALPPYRWNLEHTVLDPIGRSTWPTVFRISLAVCTITVGILLTGLAAMEYRRLAKTLGLWLVGLSPIALAACLYPWGQPLVMRQFLVWLYALTLLLCGLGAAIHYRRRSPRVLLALFVPWLLMFALMPQMHERYLVWAAVLLCVGFGLSVGEGLLSFPVIYLAWANMANVMVHNHRDWLFTTRLIRPMMPHGAWAVLMLALIYLYLALKPDRPLATDGHRRTPTKKKQIEEEALQPAPA